MGRSRNRSNDKKAGRQKPTVDRNVHDVEHETPTGGDSDKTPPMGYNPKKVCPSVGPVRDSDNDPSWYMNVKDYFDDVANVSFNNVAGLPFSHLTGNAVTQVVNGSTTYQHDTQVTTTSYTAQGIMTFEIMPTAGTLSNIHDAGNVAAQQLYTLLRSANSGRVNYDLSEPMMYVMAMDSAYMLYEWLLRAYRTLGSYNYANRYLPNHLLNAMGFSITLSNEMADFKAALDLYAYKLASVNVPDQFDIIHRHSWLFTNVYTDSSNNKAQMYLFNPNGFYQWKEGVDSSPSYLHYVTVKELTNNQTISSVAQINQLMNALLDPILGSEDVGIISGDMRKAFGSAGMISISPVESHPMLLPVYSEEVMMQIENMQIINCDPYYNNNESISNWFDITQELTNLVTGPYLRCNASAPTTDTLQFQRARKHVINMHKDNPSPEDIIVATRLIPNLSTLSYAGSQNVYTFNNYGTEIVCGARFYYIAGPTQVGMQAFNTDMRQSSANALIISGLWSQFDWAPTIYFWDVETSPSGIAKNTLVVADLDNYYWADQSLLRNLNNAAVMSEWKVKSYK